MKTRVLAAAAAMILLGGLALPAPVASAAESPDRDLIVNGAFTTGHEPWWTTDGIPFSTGSGAYCAEVPAGLQQWQAIVGQHGLSLDDGATYTVTFDAWSSVPTTVRTQVQPTTNPDLVTYLNRTSDLETERTTFTSTFTADLGASTVASSIQLRLGGNAAAATVCIDDIALTTPEAEAVGPGTDELLVNTTFDDASKPWWTSGGTPLSVATGELCADAGASANLWSLLIGQNSLYLPGDTTFRLSFDVRASVAVQNGVQIGPFDNPDTVSYLSQQFSVGTASTHHSYDFETPSADPYALSQLQLRIGGSTVPYTVCYDNVSLTGTAYDYVADTGPAVKVNQVGYLPDGPKNATVVTDATEPLMWSLDQDGTSVASGQTVPAGFDDSAGAAVHTIDFSAVTATGDALTLRVDGEVSEPFTIGADVYQSLRTDALRFFYTNRSGIEIDGDVAGAEYARAAGHVGVAPNQGDTAVGCQEPKTWTDGWTCDYTLDVSGGWYDAGDHGKYVVNGGIAVAQLLSTWERAVQVGTQDELGDSTLAIPERDNGVPDILDEARWELDFMLAMQVPEGEELAGMVHHKVQDETWTGLPLLPSADPKPRQLHRPSTAATLNLAAVAAQGSRAFATIDPDYAATLRSAALRAYAAARTHPDLFATREDGVDGGGAYADDDVTDELYWAAAELYLTTGEATYLSDVENSPLHTADVFGPGGFYWGSVAPLARMQLARFGDSLEDIDEIRASVVAGADDLVAQQAAQPFGQPYAPEDGRYVWGSSSSILNNQVVLATAFDLTAAPVYARAVLEGYDYLLGRNILGQSYITGYGENSAENQHSRWYANQLDASLPHPPVGSVAGGPNSDLQDPVSQAWLTGCAPQACYVDNIEAWAVNEITVNWGSALTWVASFVADQGSGEASVDLAPTFSSEPQDVIVTAGSDAELTASVQARPVAEITWQQRDGDQWVDLGRTGTTLVLSEVDETLDGQQVHAVASNGVGEPVASRSATVTVVQPDAAVAPPAQAVLVHDNGWDTGLLDGDFVVTVHLWWGENATRFRLFQDGELLATVPLTYGGTRPQEASVTVSGLRDGTYVYTGELISSQGVTVTVPTTVSVTQAAPGVPVLSHGSIDRDGSCTVTANLWWGTPGTSYRLFEDGEVVAEGTASALSPTSQRLDVPLTARAPGSREYVVELTNDAGSSRSAPLTVVVES
ncbi:glycoside hydrolase family 9 protein [Sanguibacter antarcticus]|uniref:Endoglucanase n=1 Tax=Sanguibacter antarcticus TaxID=372484 RepID=A0A2A9E869_9MICO|nr:glycoside hydrolase family 9 protein [Sanguibacter antarcticus]PFG34429.1 endoglucanase [Sanguibacter antarcticus]